MNVGCHVGGSHGEFLPSVCNPDGSQASRQKRARLQGTIMEAKGEKRWLVRFDNDLEKECPSVTLKMLGDPRYNRASVTSAPIASDLITSTHDALAPVALALVTSAPVASTPDTSITHDIRLQSLPLQLLPLQILLLLTILWLQLLLLQLLLLP